MVELRPNELAFLETQLTDLRKLYKPTPSFNTLIYGKPKTGKTTLISTARLPILIDSFDAKGTDVEALKALKEKGECIVDGRYEAEDFRSPTAFALWEHTFDQRKRNGFFNSFATYVIDSMTTWAQAMMNQINAAAKRPGQPAIQDYGIQQRTAQMYYNMWAELPCDVFLLAHVDIQRDEVSGKMETGLLVPGKLSPLTQNFFSNVFLTQKTNTPSGPQYSLMCLGDGFYVAGSRDAGKVLTNNEPTNIKAIIKKAGLSDADLPPLPGVTR